MFKHMASTSNLNFAQNILISSDTRSSPGLCQTKHVEHLRYRSGSFFLVQNPQCMYFISDTNTVLISHTKHRLNSERITLDMIPKTDFDLRAPTLWATSDVAKNRASPTWSGPGRNTKRHALR